MDDNRLRKLSKQIRLLNVLLVTVALVFVAGFAATVGIGYLAVQEVRKTNDQLRSVQQSVTSAGGSATDLQEQLCNSSGTLKALISSQTDVCN